MPIIKLAQKHEGEETAKPWEDERLHYVGNEIKLTKTGDWQAHEGDVDSNSVSLKVGLQTPTFVLCEIQSSVSQENDVW